MCGLTSLFPDFSPYLKSFALGQRCTDRSTVLVDELLYFPPSEIDRTFFVIKNCKTSYGDTCLNFIPFSRANSRTILYTDVATVIQVL